MCTFASAKRSHQGALWPFWEKQIMPMGHPMEWRLDGAVTTIGELLLRVGGPQDSFAGLNCMKLHVQLDVRLVVRIMKRNRFLVSDMLVSVSCRMFHGCQHLC